MLEFDPRILCGESPIGPGVLLVAIGLPGLDLAGEETVTSTGHAPREARNRPKQSVSPLFRHRKFAGQPAWLVVCGSGRLQSPLRPAVCGPGKSSRRWSQEPL